MIRTVVIPVECTFITKNAEETLDFNEAFEHYTCVGMDYINAFIGMDIATPKFEGFRVEEFNGSSAEPIAVYIYVENIR